MSMYLDPILANSVGVLTGKLCSNPRNDGSRFCDCHQDITPEEHKRRWVRKFLLGSDGSPFLYTYDERKQQRILHDLLDGTIELTAEDIKAIPTAQKYIDIYVLLFSHGLVDLCERQNAGLYLKSILYLTEFLYLGNTSTSLPFTPLANHILNQLVLKDAIHLQSFLSYLPWILKTKHFQGELILKARIVPLTLFLSSLLDSEAAKKLSWEPFRDNVLKTYEDQLGSSHLVTSYVREVYLPEFYDLYKSEKKLQKDRIDSLKEELMAYAWHPDRFLTWCLDEEEKAENRMLFG